MKVKLAKRKITPTGKFFPCYLSGHAIRVDKAKGILDDIYVYSNYMKMNDENSLLFVAVDLVGLDRDFTDRIRTNLSKKYTIDKNRINISFIHTHSAPEYSSKPFFSDSTKAVPGYIDFVEEKIYEAVEECLSSSLFDTEVYYNVTNIEGYYSNRNGKDKIADKDITTIVFKDKQTQKYVGGICNYTFHPTVLGPENLYVSADLAGYIRSGLEKKYGCDIEMINGAAGDMSNRLYRLSNDEKELKRTGEGVLEQLYKNDKLIKINCETLKVYDYKYQKVFYNDRKQEEDSVAEIKAKLATSKDKEVIKTYTSALAAAEFKVKNFQETSTLDIVSNYYIIGELSIFTMPAELFSRFGMEIKKAMANKCNILYGYCNYSVGYLFNKDDYGKSFESAVSNMTPGTTEVIVEDILKFINKKQ